MKTLIISALAALALLLAPAAHAVNYLDNGTHDEMLDILDPDGTVGEWTDSVHGEWDDDGAHPDILEAAGPAYLPQTMAG